ncbi:MAG: putative zinc-binding metallopeptidase [Prevotellaceae bacterium]|jgi:substrate import-associated zinc metallohydrolase lipoprotein|nr:putative zinc-binding metallopeptidase [Prevotellaceae bacterium]
MKNINKYILAFAVGVALLGTSCKEDELTDSIFDTAEQDLDVNSYTYKLDSFLLENYQKPYNLNFIYKMEDKGVDMNYNLIPATIDSSKKMAVLTKYLWFDVYGKVVSPEFLKAYGPRIIHLIGSPAYNPSSGTILLGLAEGGIKVSLFRVNDINPNDVEFMNEMYFKTMHHEFAHILHQTKTYPKDFNLISFKDYNPLGWQDRHDNIALSLGFVTPYASSQTREDWVEVIANYIVKTDAWWENALNVASQGWIQRDKMRPESGVDPAPDEDGVNGAVVIITKLDMCKDWMRTKWNIDLEELRNEVQYRQSHIDIDSLLNQLHY